MNNEQKRELCLALMHADSEADVISILQEANLWDDKRVWRLYGDRENNVSTIGNQQSKPDAALVEKLVNSVDARLMHECLRRGFNPESPAAPQTTVGAIGGLPAAILNAVGACLIHRGARPDIVIDFRV